MPAGVWIATARQSGMLCVTRRNSIRNGPTVDRLPRRRPATSRFAASMPCSSSFGSTSASVNRDRVDGTGHPVDDVRDRPDVVLVPVRQDERAMRPR